MEKDVLLNRAIRYCQEVVGLKICANKDIRKVCSDFLKEFELMKNPEYKYYLDLDKIEQIEHFLGLLKFADGVKDGKELNGLPIIQEIDGWQSFLLVNFFGVVHSDDWGKRRYEELVLLVARKSGKTFLTGVIILILMITEPKYSQFFSISTENDSAKLIFEEMWKIIDVSGLENVVFRKWKDYMKCIPTQSKFKPLSKNVRDGGKPSAFVADEVGAYKNADNINAMKGGQSLMKNKTRIYISTAYPNEGTAWTDIIKYSRKVLSGEVKDDKVFPLLYYADLEEVDVWSDEAIYQANPFACSDKEVFNQRVEQREVAKEIESELLNYKVKYLNIFLNQGGENALTDKPTLEENLINVNEFDWHDKECILGVDLSKSNDNSAITLTHRDEKNIVYVKSWCFIPKGKLEEKDKTEKSANYYSAVENGICILTGNKTIEYKDISDFIFNHIIGELGVRLKVIAYDSAYTSRFLDFMKMGGFDKEEQYYSVPQYNKDAENTVRTMIEKFLNTEFRIERNNLFELNVLNAFVWEDFKGKRAIRKRENAEFNKIDMVAALFMAMHYYVEIERYKPEVTWVDPLESLGY